jgi:hypothetical protein
MITEDIEEYRQRAIKECQRIYRLHPDGFVKAQYIADCHIDFTVARVKYRLKWQLNDLKNAAGVPIIRKGGHRKLRKTTTRSNSSQGGITRRTCNMEDCGNKFDAVDHMRSCPSCTKTKNNTESWSGGLDEISL